MRRLKRWSDPTNLDPLMDVVTNVVGVMLFVVIFAVIEARSASITMLTPMLTAPKSTQSRVFYLCDGRTLRKFDFDSAQDDVSRMAKGLTLAGLPRMVKRFNDAGVRHGDFVFRLEHQIEWPTRFRPSIKLFLISEDARDAAAPSPDLDAFANSLDALDPAQHWIAFLVDASAIETFRAARDLAAQRGFAVGWDPGSLSFPGRHCLAGCGGSGDDVGLGAGPQSGG